MLAKPCISLTTRQTMHAEVTAWLLGAASEMAPHVAVDLVVLPYPLEYARNEQVRRFLASDCTHLFILDADCVPQPRTIQRLLTHKLPFVAAPHPTRIGNETGLMIMEAVGDGTYHSNPPYEGMMQADVVGCAGMLIRRDVLENLRAPWFTFEMTEDGGMGLGEDFGFCERIREMGVEVWADCDLVQKHWVTVAL